MLVDTLELLMHAVVHSANIQDRDGRLLVLGSLFGRYPFLKKLFADGPIRGRLSKKRKSQKSARGSARPAHHRDRQKVGQAARIRAAAKTMDRRANLRMARPLP
jgi:hypothetical protein